MFRVYRDVLVQYHRALIHHDSPALKRMLTASAVARIDEAALAAGPLGLPLSEDIEVEGISVEGSGAVTTVHYTNRIAATGGRVALDVDVVESDGHILIAQPLPTVVPRSP